MTLLRRAGAAVLTPFYSSLRSGHFRSALLGRPQDARGQSLPWYSYPAIDFLAACDLTRCSVLELGAGASTLWWAGRVRRLVALEADAAWHARLAPRVPPGVSLRLVGGLRPDLRAELGDDRFDLIVVDGLDRGPCAREATERLELGGALILDDSQVPWRVSRDETLVEHLRERGFARVDFHGHSPGVVHIQCTSFFFRGCCFLFEDQAPPPRL